VESGRIPGEEELEASSEAARSSSEVVSALKERQKAMKAYIVRHGRDALG
jgi:hypothetical protein